MPSKGSLELYAPLFKRSGTAKSPPVMTRICNGKAATTNKRGLMKVSNWRCWSVLALSLAMLLLFAGHIRIAMAAPAAGALSSPSFAYVPQQHPISHRREMGVAIDGVGRQKTRERTQGARARPLLEGAEPSNPAETVQGSGSTPGAISTAGEASFRDARLPAGLGTWLQDDGSESVALQVFYDAVVSQGTDPREPPDLFEVAAWMVGRGRVKLRSDCVVVEMPHAKIHVPLVHHLFRRYMATRRPSVRQLLLAVLRAGARVDFETADILRTDRTPIIVQCVESVECDLELLDELLWQLRDARAYRAEAAAPLAPATAGQYETAAIRSYSKKGTSASSVGTGSVYYRRQYGMSLAHLLPTRSVEVEWVRRFFQLFAELQALDPTRRQATAVLLPMAVRRLNHRPDQAWLGDPQSFVYAFDLCEPMRRLLDQSRGMHINRDDEG